MKRHIKSSAFAMIVLLLLIFCPIFQKNVNNNMPSVVMLETLDTGLSDNNVVPIHDNKGDDDFG